jgi:hypothetical protein
MNVKPDGRIAVSKSINIGTPNLNPWGSGLAGSYFNNFDANDDVADILRFIAGLLSASAPAPAPNTRTWVSTNVDFEVGGSSIDRSIYMTGVLAGLRNARLSQEWNQSNSIITGNTGSYRNLQTYLIGKSWMNSSETGSQTLHDAGTHPFGTVDYGFRIPDGIYTTNFSNFTFNVDSSVGSTTTTFSSSLGANAFGIGEIETAPSTVKPYSLSIIYTQSFSSTASITDPAVASTYSTGSVRLYTITSTAQNGTNGLYVGVIQTGNPLIPNTYQDAYFLNSPASFATRKWGDSGTAGNVTSSIGYYKLHGISIGLTSSLTPGFVIQSPGSTRNAFYMPSLGTLGVTNITQNDPTVTITGIASIASFSATSRSLSGAPYISSSTYTVQYNTEVSKSFDPCYGNSTVPLLVTKTDGWDTVGATTLSNTSVSVTTDGIQTNAPTAGVFPAGGNPSTRRSLNAIPAIGDVVFASSSYTFTLDSNFYSASANYNLSFTTTGRNWRNTSTAFNTVNIPFYDATIFGQPSASGSMAIYSRPQGYDGRTALTIRTESFSGENYRLKIDNNLLSGSWTNGTKFTTGSNDYYNLTSLDLQVKPGSLVRPGGSNGYWLPNDGTEFKYYAVAFNSNDANQINSINVNLNLTSGNVIKWNQTSIDGIACLAIFSNPTGLNNAIDIKEDSLTTQTFTAGTNGTNPFTSNIVVYKNSAVYPSVGIGDPFLLNGSNRNFVLLIRMRGDIGPINSISYSS